MTPTDLKYMDQQYLYEDDASVVQFHPAQDGRFSAILDGTILYPQGGGQPWDTGFIEGPNGRMHVEEVRFIDGFVHHYGTVEGALNEGDTARVTVHQDRRALHSRLHSGGHLLDEAVRNLGLNWQPTKGIHYPDNAAVEYAGEENGDLEVIARQIEEETNRLIEAGYATKAYKVSREELPGHSHFVMPNMPDNKPIRVVMVWGEKGVPCGGTHVADIGEIGKIAVRYVKSKKGVIKAAYELV